MFNFFLFLFFVVFIPGFVLVNKLKVKSFFLNIFLSLSTGFVLLTLFSYLSGVFETGWLVLAYTAFFILVFIASRSYLDSKLPKKISKFDLLIILVIVAGTIFQNSLTFKSGRLYDFGIGFWGPIGHDGVWHHALIGELTRNFPPHNPAFAGEKLTNYHFFYDLLVAATAKLTRITIPDLIYRYYPISFSLLLGIGTYFLAKEFLQKKLAIFISLYFIYFGSSFGWVVEWIREGNFGGESAFWANQPVSMNINPPFAISLVLLIAAALVFSVFEKRKDLASSLILIIISGSLIGFKVYAGLIFLAALGALALVNSYKLVFGAILLLSLLIFLPQNRGASSLLVFAPFWFIHSMIDFGDRVGWLRLSQARMAYLARGEWLKFTLAESLGFVIFVVGNLGTRVVGLVSFFQKRDILFWLTFFSFLPPLVFIQKGNPWNTIQFLYYFLFLMSLFAARVLVRFNPLLVVSLLIIAPISSIPTFRAGLGKIPPAYISHEEIEALNFLKNQEGGIVFAYPYDASLRGNYEAPYPLFAYSSTSYVSAYTNKEVFLEDIVQQEIFQVDYQKRLSDSQRFFIEKDLEWSKDFLDENQIDYLYLLKIFNLPAAEEEFPMTKIFENETVNVYQVLQ